MTSRSLVLSGLCSLLVVSSGCDELSRLNGLQDRTGSTIARYGDGPISRLRIHHGFRHRTILRKMQGDWVVSRGGRYILELNVKGEHAVLVDHRYRVPRTLSGPLSLRSETSFGIEGPDGVREYFSFLQTSEATYLGSGGAIALGNLEREGQPEAPQATTEYQPFTAFLGAWETLEFDGKDCLLIERWMSSINKREVACGFEDKKGRRVFHYQGRDTLRPERLKRYELEVVEGFLVEPELKRNVASRRSSGEVADEIFEVEDNAATRARERAEARMPKVAPNPLKGGSGPQVTPKPTRDPGLSSAQDAPDASQGRAAPAELPEDKSSPGLP